MAHIFSKERSSMPRVKVPDGLFFSYEAGIEDLQWFLEKSIDLKKTIYKLKFINTSLKLINKSGTYTRNGFGYVFRLNNLPNLGISGIFLQLLYKGKICRSLRIPYREVQLYSFSE